MKITSEIIERLHDYFEVSNRLCNINWGKGRIEFVENIPRLEIKQANLFKELEGLLLKENKDEDCSSAAFAYHLPVRHGYSLIVVISFFSNSKLNPESGILFYEAAEKKAD